MDTRLFKCMIKWTSGDVNERVKPLLCLEVLQFRESSARSRCTRLPSVAAFRRLDLAYVISILPPIGEPSYSASVTAKEQSQCVK